MTGEDWVKIIGAIGVSTAAIITAVGAVLQQTRRNYRAINGRMQELLTLSRAEARAEGRAMGHDATLTEGGPGGTTPRA